MHPKNQVFVQIMAVVTVWYLVCLEVQEFKVILVLSTHDAYILTDFLMQENYNFK